MNMITLISGVLTVKTKEMLTALVLILLRNIASVPKIKFFDLVSRHCRAGIAGYCNLMMDVPCIIYDYNDK